MYEVNSSINENLLFWTLEFISKYSDMRKKLLVNVLYVRGSLMQKLSIYNYKALKIIIHSW